MCCEAVIGGREMGRALGSVVGGAGGRLYVAGLMRGLETGGGEIGAAIGWGWSVVCLCVLECV